MGFVSGDRSGGARADQILFDAFWGKKSGSRQRRLPDNYAARSISELFIVVERREIVEENVLQEVRLQA